MGYGFVDEGVYGILVYFFLSIGAVCHGACGPAHAAVAEKRDAVACRWVDTMGHFVGGDGSVGSAFGRNG